MAQFTNQATITYNGVTASSNIVTGRITQALTAWKDATYDRYSPGDILTYVVSLQNSGSSDQNGLRISDDLGAYTVGTTTVTPLSYTGDPVLYYINGILQTPPTATAGPPLVLNNISVPAGLSAILVYRVRVNQYAPLGAERHVENTVTITGGTLTSPVTASETVRPVTGALLTILKALSPTTVVENGRITYTFTLENRGSAAVDVSSDLIISDTFDPRLEAPLTVMLNGVLWPQVGNYTYAPGTGTFATIAGQITVPAATYTQDPATGEWTVTPGVTTLSVSGTI